jgi:hypothetical protein
MLFFAAVVVPVLHRSQQALGAQLLRQVGLRFRVFGWVCLGLLLANRSALRRLAGAWNAVAIRAARSKRMHLGAKIASLGVSS